MDRNLKNILKSLQTLAVREGFDVYLVGGSVRDRLLARPCCDLDLTTHDAPRLARLFAASVRKRVVPLDDTPGRETLRVPIGKNLYLDFSEMQGKNIERDLSVRDFTINAMAISIGDCLATLPRIIDPHGGQRDLKIKIVRALPGPALVEDPLRIIRAFRFAATLDFRIDGDTLAIISVSRAGLRQVAVERITHELLLLLAAPNASLSTRLMAETGVWEQIIPEILELKTMAGAGKKPWEESIETCERLEHFILRPEKPFPRHFSRIGDCLAERERALLKLAALLLRLQADKLKTSPVAAVLKRLRFSKSDGLFVDKVINVESAVSEFAARFDESPRDSAARLYAFTQKSGAALIPALLLAMAGRHKHLYKRRRAKDTFMRAVDALAEFYFKRFLPARNSPVLLTGDDLADKFKLSPSPVFKIILDHVERARVLGEIKTRKEADALARELIRTL